MLVMKLLGLVLGTTVLIQMTDGQGLNGKSRAFLIRLTASSIVIVIAFSKIKPLLDTVDKMSNMANFKKKYLDIIMKSISTAYLSEIGHDICIDCGETTMANRLSMVSNIIILGQATPVINDVLNLILLLAS